MSTGSPITVALRIREAAYEAPLRQRFAANQSDAVLTLENGPTDEFAEIVAVTGDCAGPEKPMVKAQEVVGDFNLAMRERQEGGASETVA